MKARIVGLVAGFVLWQTGAAWADPIALTASSGGVFIEWDSSSVSVDLTGNGFHFAAGGVAGGSANLGEGFAGQTVTLDGFISGSPSWMGTGSINGTSVSIPGGPAGPIWRGSISFTTAPLVLPTVPDGFVTVNTPLTVSGVFGAFQSTSANAAELFRIDVSGSGTASATLRSTTLADGTHHLTDHFQGNSYAWTATPSPTPEPASLLLLASGICGVVWRRSRTST